MIAKAATAQIYDHATWNITQGNPNGTFGWDNGINGYSGGTIAYSGEMHSSSPRALDVFIGGGAGTTYPNQAPTHLQNGVFTTGANIVHDSDDPITPNSWKATVTFATALTQTSAASLHFVVADIDSNETMNFVGYDSLGGAISLNMSQLHVGDYGITSHNINGDPIAAVDMPTLAGSTVSAGSGLDTSHPGGIYNVANFNDLKTLEVTYTGDAGKSTSAHFTFYTVPEPSSALLFGLGGLGLLARRKRT